MAGKHYQAQHGNMIFKKYPGIAVFIIFWYSASNRNEYQESS
jgi:hypothetical protein